MRNDPLKTLRSKKRLDAAREHLAADRLDEARALYAQALTEDAGDVRALRGMGVLEARAGCLGAAEDWLRRALEVAPEDATALNDLGETLRLQGRADEARAVFESALRIDPDDAQVRNNLGVLEMDSDPERAQACFLAAIRLAPEFAPAYNNLGVLLERQGNYDDAAICYEAAVTVDPEFRIALENHQDLLRRFPALLEAAVERLLTRAEALANPQAGGEAAVERSP